jgi:hypothetical protein
MAKYKDRKDNPLYKSFGIWGVFGKYVIDMVQSEESVVNNTDSLLKLIIIAGAAVTVLVFCNIFQNL